MKYTFHSDARACFEVTVPYVTKKKKKKERKSQMPENDGKLVSFHKHMKTSQRQIPCFHKNAHECLLLSSIWYCL